MKPVIFEQMVFLVCFWRYSWELLHPSHILNLDECSQRFYLWLLYELYVPLGWLPIVSWKVEKCKCEWKSISIFTNNYLNSFQNIRENLVRSDLEQNLPAPAGTFSWSRARCYTGSSFTYIWYVYFCTYTQFW